MIVGLSQIVPKFGLIYEIEPILAQECPYLYILFFPKQNLQSLDFKKLTHTFKSVKQKLGGF